MVGSSAVTAIAGLFLAGALASPVPGGEGGSPQNTPRQASSTYWYANMDHTGDYRGYAPGLDISDSYSVFVSVKPEDGGAGIQSAINDASDGASRPGEWLASEPRVCITDCLSHKWPSWEWTRLTYGPTPGRLYPPRHLRSQRNDIHENRHHPDGRCHRCKHSHARLW